MLSFTDLFTMILLVLALVIAPAFGEHLPYIIGGNDVAKPGTYPWQGSLEMLGKHTCGCTLVSDKWVVTAAQCIGVPFFLTVVLGMHDINGRTKGKPEVYSVENAFVHPDYTLGIDNSPNDIALVKLEKAVNLGNAFIGIVKLAPATATNADFSNCVLTGWGAVKMVDDMFPEKPDILQEAKVGIFADDRCKRMMDGLGEVKDSHICAGEEYQSTMCTSDKGGPLVCQYKGQNHLAGVVSWGIPTCDSAFPSVGTRVSFFRDWIKETSNGDL